MAGDVPPGDEYTGEIFGSVQYEAPQPHKKQFLAWHRPRKQFVREKQWCAQIDNLLNDLEHATSLRYLGLPGVDLLDLRLFHSKICELRQLPMRFLGFNSAVNPQSQGQIELNISFDEVKKLRFVDPLSEVIGDDFRKVANKDSIAWKRALSHGPFDVVNLDLCDGFAAEAPGALDDNHYNAMSQLLSLQFRNKTSWLLLLTTRAGEGHIDPVVLQQLVQKYLGNLAACAGFRDASLQHFGFQDQIGMEAAVQTPNGLLRIFLTALCKWFVTMGRNANPAWKAELRSVIGYRVNEGAPEDDLISLALRFDPIFGPVQDGLNIAQQQQAPNECELAARVLNRVASRRKADEILAQDAALNNQMISATAELLGVARYDVAAFQVWVEQGYA